ncbi:Mediator of RNA polymerase II transcription subunit 15a [Abeliophyllum distichum]|uniref:Mediator of RNA polymerase II transcription subunit 15a n=1 Tax=Abeliophyllum distichum TaxID=126358 RepID=A0ABD1V3P0_9LAMI
MAHLGKSVSIASSLSAFSSSLLTLFFCSQSMQSQISNQGQPLPIPMVTNQSQVRQQLLPQNIQNNMPTGVPNSAGLTSALPPVGGVSQGSMPNVVGQNPNMQNLQNITFHQHIF